MFNHDTNGPSLISRRAGRGLGLAVGLTASLISVLCAAENSKLDSECTNSVSASRENLEQTWGVRVSSVFLSGGGNMVDFRYRVLDPAKAAALTKPDTKPLLIDQTTGAKLHVPTTPKVGPLRMTARQPVAGKVYFMLFANTQHHVKSGDRVTITAGDFRAEDLTVE
jgi:hypothetical protein